MEVSVVICVVGLKIGKYCSSRAVNDMPPHVNAFQNQTLFWKF